MTFVLLWVVSCGPSGAAGILQENGEAFSPALATWDYATIENVLATNTSVAATATPTPYCEPREEPSVTASLSARLEAAVAEAQIPGLEGSNVVALNRLCYGYAEGEEITGGSTWFYVGISVPGYDVAQVLDSLAAYLQMLMETFGPNDLHGESSFIYGSLATSKSGAAGEPIRWYRSVSLKEAEVRALYAQGLRGRELTCALGYEE